MYPKFETSPRQGRSSCGPMTQWELTRIPEYCDRDRQTLLVTRRELGRSSRLTNIRS
jgi:hypothetical protein